jgi:hypothetical protein
MLIRSIGLPVPHNKQIMSSVQAQQIMLSIGLWRWYINITITILDTVYRPVSYIKHDVSCRRLKQRELTIRNSEQYPSSRLLFKAQLNSIVLFVPLSKHITSPLRAQ